MKRILVDIPLHEEGLRRLLSTGQVHVEFFSSSKNGWSTLPDHHYEETEILFCSVPPKNVREMASLEFIQLSSAGYSQIFHLGLVERGIRVSHALGVFDVPIAEWNIAMMVNLTRDVKGMIENQKKGIWDRHSRFQREMRGKVVGIWGYGGIGRETARLSRSMGMKVYVMTKRGVGPREGKYQIPDTGDPRGVLPHNVFLSGEEEAFLKDLDFLILAIPLTTITEGIIGERELEALPKRAYLLNPARGPLVEEGALLKALEKGWIAGAALDTHYQYPLPAHHPLWSSPKVMMTPHIAGSSESPYFLQRVWDIFATNVEGLLGNGLLINELTEEQLQGL